LNQFEYFSGIVYSSYQLANEWSLSEELLKIIPETDSKLVYMGSEERCQNMFSHLMLQSEISLDCEFDTENFYHISSSLVQISTQTFDFVIDPFITFPFSQSGLKSIFLNPNVVKVVFSENDVRSFQRDFELFMVGVVDVQNIFQNLNEYVDKKDFAFVVNNLLEVSLDKSFQFFPWSIRPLPNEAISYARNDTKYLIRCWNKIKALYDLEDIDLSISKLQTVNVYSFPRRKALTSDFEFTVTKIRCMDHLNVNKLISNPILFELIWKWRDYVAKIVDKNPNRVISAIDIGVIVISKPPNSKNVRNICRSISLIDEGFLAQLVGLINDPREFTPPGETHGRESTAQAEAHAMD
jgi:exosome complex exonuclease RRP6